MANTEIGLVLVPPGETLTEVMETAGMSAHDLALKTNRSEEYISGVCHGYCDIDVEFAIALGKVLLPNYIFWLNLQNNYDVERSLVTKHRPDSGDRISNKIYSIVSDLIKRYDNATDDVSDPNNWEDGAWLEEFVEAVHNIKDMLEERAHISAPAEE